MKIALAQMEIALGAAEQNMGTCRSMVERSREAGAELILLPEMFICGFCAPTGEEAARFASLGEEFLRASSRENHVAIAASLPWLDQNGTLTNRLLVVDQGEVVAFYDKSHLFPLSPEGQRYNRGLGSSTPVKLRGLRCAFSICYDLRFSYLFWNQALATDVYIIVANWPESRAHHWRSLLIARAIENQSFVIGVNCVGEGQGVSYRGGSLCVRPDGTLLAELGHASQSMLVDVSSEEVLRYRASHPFLQDRQC